MIFGAKIESQFFPKKSDINEISGVKIQVFVWIIC